MRYWSYRTALMFASVVGAPVVQAQTQAMLPVTYGGEKTTPVPQSPAVDPHDSPEEIAKDAARDLKDNRFYNKPGATRAQYDADWQRCRLIARGSRTPAGSVPMFYNPQLMSPVAAGVGGALGGLIAGAIAEGQQRRANRQSCLLINGWRLVEVPSAESARVAAMSDAERDGYFNTIVGAAEVSGKVTARTRFSPVQDANLHPEAPLTGPGSVFLGKKVDAAAPFALAPNEAVVVLAFRRVEPSATGRSGGVQILRYDAAQHDLHYRPHDWKKTGDKTSYSLLATSADRKSVYEVQVHRLTPGDYVLDSLTVGPGVPTSTHCFGAPTFHLAPGEVAYIGDFIPYMGAEMAAGGKLSGLVHANHVEDARTVLARSQPALATALKAADLRNGATYACSGIVMSRWEIEGLEAIAPATEAPAAAAAPAS
ncbi:MAG: hypothetical protein P0Y64_05390 [Candidatus Sphingomonas colombiensis]|nr:hypothetical protein [Sphingomonas sp.]WEK44245.1 MAG: hypothetical protein P0Y64_05390 [Sphingomonas sp.]